MLLPDPTERGRDVIEQWWFDNVKGDTFTCDCGQSCKLNDAMTLSPDPYAIPVCYDCFKAAIIDE